MLICYTLLDHLYIAEVPQEKTQEEIQKNRVIKLKEELLINRKKLSNVARIAENSSRKRKGTPGVVKSHFSEVMYRHTQCNIWRRKWKEEETALLGVA
jgi:hypothetical protein